MIIAAMICRRMALSFLPMNLRRLRCCWIQRNRSLICQQPLQRPAISTAMRSRSLVMRVIVPPLSRLTLMRRNGIGSLESPLLASTTSASAMILKLSPVVLRTCRDFVLRKRVHLDARDEGRIGGACLLPPAKVIITFVET